MAREIEIEVIQREIVKPSSPTPENFRRYEFSSLDQLMPADRVSLLLFYPHSTHLLSISETSQLLMKSLSQTLTRFYNFAGRLGDENSIECNDEGAEFESTRVNCPVSTILSNPDMGTLTKLIPRQVFLKEERFTSPLLLVKANFFDCGGLAIGACLSHKVGDASTFSMFLTCWASAASNSELDIPLIPQFVSPASIFPPIQSLASSVWSEEVLDTDGKIKVKRLVFHGSRIDALKSKAADNSTVRNPTRVEAVSALIWKCGMEALSVPNSLNSSFYQSVNLRKRMNPCLPENSVGNLAFIFKTAILSSVPSDEVELKDLVVLLREGLDKVKEVWRRRSPSEALGVFLADISGQNHDLQFVISSWCRFPLYGADFGWGKPAWVCSPVPPCNKNMFVMMDTSDGEGIEVTLLLGVEEMKHFETNLEILAYASFDSAITI